VRGEGWNVHSTPNAENIFALELCVSDVHKTLLLNSKSDFIPFLIDALLLDPAHPRAEMTDEQKSWLQTSTAECLAQLAVFEPGRTALQQDATVLPALQAVAEAGLSAQAGEFAQAALRALSDKKLEMVSAESQKHVMLSYQWDKQATVMRINESLIARGYVTWFDLTNMKVRLLLLLLLLLPPPPPPLPPPPLPLLVLFGSAGSRVLCTV
jgi:hypothetical protein